MILILMKILILIKNESKEDLFHQNQIPMSPRNQNRLKVLIPASTNKSLFFLLSPTLRFSLIYIVNDTKRLQFNSALLKVLRKHLQNLITY